MYIVYLYYSTVQRLCTVVYSLYFEYILLNLGENGPFSADWNGYILKFCNDTSLQYVIYNELENTLCLEIKIVFLPVLRIRIRIRSDPVFLGHTDLDPDPGKYRIRILYSQKNLKFKFSRYIKLFKIQFRPNNFLSFILSVIRSRCLDLVRKCHKNIYFAKHQKHI